MYDSSVEKVGYGPLHWLVAFLLVLSLIALVMAGCGPGGNRCGATTFAGKAPATIAVAPAAAIVAAPAAAINWGKVESVPAAKIYFALDKTEVPATTDKTLAEVVAYLKSNSEAQAHLSGFHDPTGDKAHNESLALNRARQVREALGKLGIANDRVVMDKPVETTGTGNNAEARRVDVSVWVAKK